MRILIVASVPFESMRRRQQQVALGLSAQGHEVLYLNPPRPFRSLMDPGRFELDEIPLDQISSCDEHGQADRVSPGSAASVPKGVAGDTGSTVSLEGSTSTAPAGNSEPAAAVESTEPAAIAQGTESASATGPMAQPENAGEDLRVAGVRIRSVQPGLHVAEKGVAFAAMGRWGWATRAGWKRWGAEVRAVIATLSDDGKDSSERFSFRPEVALVYHPALIRTVREIYAGPLVFDCLDDFPSLARSRSIAAAYEEVLTEGLPLVDGMIAVNRYLLESWGRLLRPEIPEVVIEHGVDLSLFRPPDVQRKAAVRSALGIPPDLKTICYLGRADARISYEDLRTMMSLDEETLFLFVGEVSPEGRAIFQRFHGQRIMPVGPIRPEQAADVVAASEVLIFPFRREPHLESVRGLKLYEYLATGRPVVASFRRTLKAFRELLYLYTTREELEEAFGAALAEPEKAPQQAARISRAHDAAWSRRIAEVESFLQNVMQGA
ncbi:MAG: glycosyltransferase family 4 protein [Candidatus Eisenbacteria sp.]|nr:glycosyltransferase family 4 protein [Candidatus Eisenbacteria bacterium]